MSSTHPHPSARPTARPTARASARRTARRAVTGALAGLLLAGAAQVAALPAAVGATDPTDPAPEPVAVEMRIVTYNIQAKLAPEDAVADLRRLVRRGADVIDLQEMGSTIRRNAVRAALTDCETCPFDAYMPSMPAMGATPILYDSTRFVPVASGSELASDATDVGRFGAGPRVIAAKYVNWVTLQEVTTGRVFTVVNNHAVATVQNRACRPNTRSRARIALFRKHMRTLQTVVTNAQASGGVFVTGDFNVNYRCDVVVQHRLFPVRRLGGLGLRASYADFGMPARGTHARNGGTRLIDQVWYLPMEGLTPLRQGIPLRFRSDHRPLVVDFSLV